MPAPESAPGSPAARCVLVCSDPRWIAKPCLTRELWLAGAWRTAPRCCRGSCSPGCTACRTCTPCSRLAVRFVQPSQERLRACTSSRRSVSLLPSGCKAAHSHLTCSCDQARLPVGHPVRLESAERTLQCLSSLAALHAAVRGWKPHSTRQTVVMEASVDEFAVYASYQDQMGSPGCCQISPAGKPGAGRRQLRPSCCLRPWVPAQVTAYQLLTTEHTEAASSCSRLVGDARSGSSSPAKAGRPEAGATMGEQAPLRTLHAATGLADACPGLVQLL